MSGVDAAVRWQVTIEHPNIARPFVAAYALPTMHAAVSQALHDFSVRTDRNLNGITRLEVVKACD